MSPQPDDRDAVADAARAVSDATRLVRQLIADGTITADALGLPPAAAPAVPPLGTHLVPGEPITVAALAEKTLAGCPPNTARTYGSYIRLLAHGWPAQADPEDKIYPGLGERWAHDVLPSDLEEALRHVHARTLLGAERRGRHREDVGRVVRRTTAAGAQYNAVGAWRRMFSVAVKDRHLAKGFDPAQEVDKPRRSGGKRQALPQHHYDQLWELVRNSGDDPELDELVCETIVIAGARQEGILNLSLDGIDRTECTLRLDEKFGKVVHQPVPDWFVAKVHAFAVSRGATRPGDPVFVKRAKGTRPAAPITNRRFDNIFATRLQSAFEWADRQQVTGHTLRHHAIAVIERAASKAVSLRFARHEPEDVNDEYSRATETEVAQAVVAVYGGDHPWLHRPPQPRTD